jgi:XTP/dITP diphosphohydrolase
LKIAFATSNKHKFTETSDILAKEGIDIEHLDFRHNEIRSDSIEEIALEAVQAAYQITKKPVFVEDTGLFINSLNGFPGTFSAWTIKKIGIEGILRLMNQTTDRKAEFRTCIAYHDGKQVHKFIGICKGTITKEALGKDGFGYDPIFIPEGETETFAQNIGFKNKLSHRYKSLLKFSTFLKQ